MSKQKSSSAVTKKTSSGDAPTCKEFELLMDLIVRQFQKSAPSDWETNTAMLLRGIEKGFELRLFTDQLVRKISIEMQGLERHPRDKSLIDSCLYYNNVPVTFAQAILTQDKKPDRWQEIVIAFADIGIDAFKKLNELKGLRSDAGREEFCNDSLRVANYFKGNAYFESAKFTDAIHCILEGMKCDKLSRDGKAIHEATIQALEILGSSYCSIGAYKKSRDTLEKIPHNKRSPRSLAVYGISAHFMHEWDIAITAFQTVLKMNQDTEVLALLGASFILKGAIREGEKCFNDVGREFDSIRYRSLGEYYLTAGDAQKAEKLFDEALKHLRKTSVTYVQDKQGTHVARANCYFAQGKYGQTISEIDAVIPNTHKESDWIEARIMKGLCLTYESKFNDAYETVREISFNMLSGFPIHNHHALLEILVSAATHCNDDQIKTKAKQEATTFFEKLPTSTLETTDYKKLMSFFSMIGDNERLKKVVQAGLDNSQKDPKARAYFARSFAMLNAQQGNFDNATHYINLAAQLDPKHFYEDVTPESIFEYSEDQKKIVLKKEYIEEIKPTNKAQSSAVKEKTNPANAAPLVKLLKPKKEKERRNLCMGFVPLTPAPPVVEEEQYIEIGKQRYYKKDLKPLRSNFMSSVSKDASRQLYVGLDRDSGLLETLPENVRPKVLSILDDPQAVAPVAKEGMVYNKTSVLDKPCENGGHTQKHQWKAKVLGVKGAGDWRVFFDKYTFPDGATALMAAHAEKGLGH